MDPSITPRGILIMHEEPKPDTVAHGLYLNCEFAVTEIISYSDGLTLHYVDENRKCATYTIDNDTTVNIRNGRLCWSVDCRTKIQHFALQMQ